MPATTLLLALLAPPATDVVVVTATRVPHRQQDLPAAVSVIDEESIRSGQWRVNASEALVRVPGLVVRNRENYAQDLQISTRGFGARAAFGVRGVRLLADGIPASMPDGQGQAATFNLDIAERIEVLRGPIATLYGNHAGGVIQLLTREPSDTTTVGASFMAGSDGTRKWDVNASGKLEATGYLLDLSRFDTDGYRQHSAARREQAFVKLRHGAFTLTASKLEQAGTQDPLGVSWTTWQRDPRAVEPNLAERFNTRKDIRHHQAGLRYDAGPLQVVAYAGERRVVQFQAFTPAFQSSPGHSGGVVDFDRGFGGGYLRYHIVAGDLRLSIGGEIERSRDVRTGYENFIGAQLGVRGRLRRDEDDVLRGSALYVQAELRQGPLRWHAGMRHSRLGVEVIDRYTANGNDSGSARYRRTTPMAGMTWQVGAKSSLYASFAQGFEAPTLNELFYSRTGAGLNFGLRPSTSRHLEAGYKSDGLQLGLFGIRTEDELAVDSASGGRTVYRNAGATRRSGIELSYDVQWPGNLSSHVAATALRARRDRLHLPGTPARTGYADLRWHSGRFNAALEWQGASRVYPDEQNTEQAAPGYGSIAASFAVSQQYGNLHASHFIRISNLTDRRYIGSVIVGDANKRFYESAPGRQVMFGLELRSAR